MTNPLASFKRLEPCCEYSVYGVYSVKFQDHQIAMKTLENRVDSSLLSKRELAMLKPMLDMAHRSAHSSLKGSDGTEIPIPEALFQMLIKVAQDMLRGKAIVLMPEDETFTTQAAANFLGMSRQYFVTLLESDQIPFHRVGTHRRVYFKDLRDYAAKRDVERRGRLNDLFKRVKKEGRYDSNYTGDDAG